MNQEEFKQLYMCEPWKPSPKEQELYNIAKFYHETCEAFDQIHCSLRDKDGIAMPANRYEMKLIVKNAHEVRINCRKMGAKKGLGRGEIDTAINHFNDYR